MYLGGSFPLLSSLGGESSVIENFARFSFPSASTSSPWTGTVDVRGASIFRAAWKSLLLWIIADESSILGYSSLWSTKSQSRSDSTKYLPGWWLSNNSCSQTFCNLKPDQATHRSQISVVINVLLLPKSKRASLVISTRRCELKRCLSIDQANFITEGQRNSISQLPSFPLDIPSTSLSRKTTSMLEKVLAIPWFGFQLPSEVTTLLPAGRFIFKNLPYSR